MQLRGFSTLLNAQVVLSPMHPYSETILSTMYDALVLPQLSSLKADFFDMNAAYMGSYDLYTNNFPNLTIGALDDVLFDELWLGVLEDIDLYTESTDGDMY
mmetsp:Transcript_21945/g.16293  ORF Transcript_21945/g.16293 Transcript_21945/m.16293 type:complete len:101 (+) Transcript_21945:918-1220(+)